MPELRQTEIVRIPREFGPKVRVEIGKDVVKLIRRRTKSGISKFGTLFPQYSESYDRSGTANLSRTGEMLSDLKVLRHGAGFIVIGFSDSQSNDKASFNKKNRRNFMGISKGDLQDILDKHAA